MAARHPRAAVLAADTVVTLDGALLGKPADANEAIAMLRVLAGRTHQVYTAVSVVAHGSFMSRLSLSDVTMRPYSDPEITAYVATGDPLDKAGAYAIQHPLFSPVAEWKGCYAAIMGLPLSLVKAMLIETGLQVPGDVVTVCGELSQGTCCAAQTPVSEPWHIA